LQGLGKKLFITNCIEKHAPGIYSCLTYSTNHSGQVTKRLQNSWHLLPWFPIITHNAEISNSNRSLDYQLTSGIQITVRQFDSRSEQSSSLHWTNGCNELPTLHVQCLNVNNVEQQNLWLRTHLLIGDLGFNSCVVGEIGYIVVNALLPCNHGVLISFRIKLCQVALDETGYSNLVSARCTLAWMDRSASETARE